MPNKHLTDEELIIVFRQGNQDAWNILLKRYQNLSKHLATTVLNQFNNTSVTSEELQAIGVECFYFALKEFDDRGNTFMQFWSEYAKNKMLTYVHYEIRTSLYSSSTKNISLDAPIKDEQLSYGEVIGQSDVDISKNSMIRDVLDVINNPDCKINSTEKTVIKYSLRDYTVQDIAEITKWHEARIRRAKRTGIEKIKNFLLKK